MLFQCRLEATNCLGVWYLRQVMFLTILAAPKLMVSTQKKVYEHSQVLSRLQLQFAEATTMLVSRVRRAKDDRNS
ncbi:MAG TPA: hypothetical protein DCX34_08405 [Roseovarius sp.]|nr:hypothetical protein [Roseovarius sp.]